jgi:hypothetical protein
MATIQAGTFELMGSYKGIGDIVATIVAPGKDTGSEPPCASFACGTSSLDVLAIDPNTGKTEVFHSPVGGEGFARNLAVGPSGDVFLGTQPTAHFLKLDRKRRQLLDIGRPSTTESYIWDVAFGSDNRMYGATCPRCKFVRFCPSTGRPDDPERMDPTEQYAHFIVGSADGFPYIGIGCSEAKIAAYNIRTGEHRAILPVDAQAAAIARAFRGTDGKYLWDGRKPLISSDGMEGKRNKVEPTRAY